MKTFFYKWTHRLISCPCGYLYFRSATGRSEGQYFPRKSRHLPERLLVQAMASLEPHIMRKGSQAFLQIEPETVFRCKQNSLVVDLCKTRRSEIHH